MQRSLSKPKSDRRLKAERQGRRGETLAALYLQAQLYQIVARRFKTPVGEIDLIAERFGTTVFVEVKARGRAEGVFRRAADAVDVHMMISSFCIFRVANRHTFGALFGRDLMDGDRREHYRAMLGDMVVDYLRASEG